MINENEKLFRKVVLLLLIGFSIDMTISLLTDNFLITLATKFMFIGILTWIIRLIWKKASDIEQMIKNYRGRLSPNVNIQYLKHAMIVLLLCLSAFTLANQFEIEDYNIPIIAILGFYVSGITAGYLPLTRPSDNEFRGKK